MTSSLAARAARVFPGGKHTRLPLQAVPGPQFLSHGNGCRVVDSEGREWIDYLAGFGANVLGYNHQRVEAAAAEAARRGATLTGPTELSLSLAERLVARVSSRGEVPHLGGDALGRNGAHSWQEIALLVA